MKTTINKTGFIAAIFSMGFLLSSFTPNKKTTSVKDNWEEYSKVQEYAYKHICVPISKGLISDKKTTVKYFSRCPSGYQTEMGIEVDSIATNKFVNGEVVFYKGCEPEYVCDFKVCVDRNFAMVRSKGSKEYMSVSAWIQKKNNANKTV